ncbi:hypothetical protein PF004_g3358, partial [Phytophthora fragariae]
MKQMHLKLCNLAAADVYEANTLDTQSYSKSESENPVQRCDWLPRKDKIPDNVDLLLQALDTT